MVVVIIVINVRVVMRMNCGLIYKVAKRDLALSKHVYSYNHIIMMLLFVLLPHL